MKVLVLIALLLAVGWTSPSHANPDGPLGTLVLVPRYVRDSGPPTATDYRGVVFEKKEHTNWLAGVTVEIPVASFLTVGFEATRIHYAQLDGEVEIVAPPSGDYGYARIGSSMRTNLGISMRIYIPFMSGARAGLER